MTTEETSAHAPVPGDPDYPLHSEKTIGRYFRDQVAIDPDHEFVVYPDRMLRWTYKDFDERTDNLARGLLWPSACARATTWACGRATSPTGSRSCTPPPRSAWSWSR